MRWRGRDPVGDPGADPDGLADPGQDPAEQANPVNRWLTNIYRPAIDWTMRRPRPCC
jgi:hypothetical protein